MLTVRHITPEGESTFGVERVRLVRGIAGGPDTLFADEMPLVGGLVYVMNDRGSTVGKYMLDKASAKEGGR